MPYKNFNDIPVFTQVIVAIAGIWGAVINWVDRKRRGKTLFSKILFFSFDVFSTVGISIMVFLMLSGYGFNELFSVGCASFMAHYGTRSFYLIEVIIADKLKIEKDKLKDIR